MAMIKCPECGKDISDKAAACPHCGNPIASLFEKKNENKENDDEIQRYLALARRAKEENNGENATRYYDLVLQKDPFNWEAAFYQVYFKAMECKIIEISSAAMSIANCLDNVLYLIKSQEASSNQSGALAEIFARIGIGAAALRNGAYNHYSAHSTVDGVFNECAGRIVTCGNIYDSFIKAAQNNFPEEKQIISGCAEVYITYIINNIKMYNRDFATRKIAELQELVKQTKPSYVALELPSSSSGGCYIATAVYGSYDCPEVWTLRRYRDYKLAKTIYGRAFIKIYYAISPILVKYFGDTKLFKKLWKKRLDVMVHTLQLDGFESTPYRDSDW